MTRLKRKEVKSDLLTRIKQRVQNQIKETNFCVSMCAPAAVRVKVEN